MSARGLRGTAQDDAEFFVDLERRYENTYWWGRYKWELREGTAGNARLVAEHEISTKGNTWTLRGARRAARRAKRRVLKSRAEHGRYLPREVVR